MWFVWLVKIYQYGNVAQASGLVDESFGLISLFDDVENRKKKEREPISD